MLALGVGFAARRAAAGEVRRGQARPNSEKKQLEISKAAENQRNWGWKKGEGELGRSSENWERRVGGRSSEIWIGNWSLAN